MKLKLLLALSCMLPISAFAEIAVIVHPSNSAAVADADVKALYLGKKRTFENGQEAVPLNLNEGLGDRSGFNQNALGKSDSQLKAYWSKLVFTGKGTPPKEVDEAEMLKLVANNPNMIGYIDASKADGSVKVVAKY